MQNVQDKKKKMGWSLVQVNLEINRFKRHTDPYHAMRRGSWVDARPLSIFRFSASLVVVVYKLSKIFQPSSD